jgi:DNA-binding CsgD family transcriptional regulator
MGKSRLVSEGTRIAGRMSFRVGGGAAEPGESVVELAPLMAALFDGHEPLLDREALQALHALPEQRYWLLQDLQALLERASLQQPLLVCLDDLQWADSGTAAALRALPARLAALPIAWVIAFRPAQGSSQLLSAVDYLEQAGAEKLVLGPLDDAAVAQVAVDVMQAEPDDALLELVKRVHGSPFFLMELLSGLRDERLVRVEDGQAELIEGRLPRRVRDSMRERLRGMSEPAREAALVAASLGRRFSFSDLATMLDQPPPALLSPVEELIKFGVVIENDQRLAFRHDIVRGAVRASLPASARRALDRQAADVLLAAGAAPVEVATQLAASAEPGDELAIATLLRAAEALGTTDPGAGADLSQRALEVAPRAHPLRGPLVAETAVLLHAAARVEEAKAFADTALRQALPAEQEAEVRLGIAGMFALSPDVRADASRQALALPGLPKSLRARHMARLIYNLLVAGRPREARAMLPEARAEVSASGDAGAAFTLELAEGGLEYVDGRLLRSLELVESAMRLGLGTGDDASERMAAQWRCGALAVLDRTHEALEVAADGATAAVRDRQEWAVHVFETWRGRELLQMGRLDDAAAVLEGRFEPDEARLVVGVGDAAGLVALGRVALHAGNARETRRTTEIAKVMLAQSAPGVRRHAAWLLALQAMADGNPAGAREWLCALGEEERKSILPRFAMDVTDEAQMVRIAVASEDLELGESAVAAAERRAQLNPDVRSITATAAHARGLLTNNLTELERAVELFEQSPRPLALAASLEDLGVARAANGAADRAIQALDRALALFAQAGATRDAGRVRGRLRSLGVRRRLVTSDRPEAGWAAMTDSELAVARLVAQGLTNREVAEQLFVSPHTVSSHLRRVFTKLDVNSRVELTRLAGDYERRS